MSMLPETAAEILPPNPIRVETALSRYPVHRLAKHGDIAIDIRQVNEYGELSIKWEVDYPKKHGQAGPLAYKLDTLIINRRIENASRPIPKIIRLGSLREITEELGISTHATDSIRKALRQNAGALITTKIRYRKADGSPGTLEADFTRYSVILTGEELPDGRKADAVYIILNDIYMQVINGAVTRPLDYDYLKSLPPASQRFYELLSYQMYAAIKNDRPRAKLLYSEFCTYAPLVRQFDWNIARPQLARIHAPHRKSGYIRKIDFQDTVDSDGKPDWEMLYQPGPKARAEYRAFTKRGVAVMLEAEPFTADPLPELAAPGPTPLEAELTGYGITPAIAAALHRDHGEETIRAQIDYLKWLAEHRPKKKIDDIAAYLVTAIRNGHAAPKGFVSPAEQQRRADAKRQAAQQAAAARRREHKQKADEQAKQAEVDAYIKRLKPVERMALEADVLAQASPEARENYDSPIMARYRDTLMFGMLREHVSQLLSSREAADA